MAILKYLLWKILGPRCYLQIQTNYWVRKLRRVWYESENMAFLRSYLKAGSICIDVGANVGQYCYELSNITGPQGAVIAFEPVKYTYQLLKAIKDKLKLDNVQIYNLGLGETSATLPITVIADSWGVPNLGLSHLGTSQDANIYSVEPVRIESLDRLDETLLHLNSCAFIKIDVEGAECQVLKGARHLLQKYHPLILMEVNEHMTRRMGYSPDELFNHLRGIGYDIYRLKDGRLIPYEHRQECRTNSFFCQYKQVRESDQ